MLVITPAIKIRLSEMEWTYVRSSGPGGQNVNKVNSKAVLRWSLLMSSSLSENVRTYLLSRLASKITTDGELIFSSDRFRDQGRNREDCLDKLRDCLLRASQIPKIRKKTKPSRSSQRKAKEIKGKHSEKKGLRRSPRDYD